MVVGFVISTVASDVTRVIFSFMFELDGAVDVATTDQLRALRKEQAMHVACQVQSEYSFLRASSQSLAEVGMTTAMTRGGGGGGGGAGEDEKAVHEHGLFRVRPGMPFTGDDSKVVLWQATAGAGYALVCEEEENRVVAAQVLCLLVQYLQEHVKSAEQPAAEFMLKSDRVMTVLHQFLPNGQLLFLNHRAVRQLEKEMEVLLQGK
ncbi:AP-5 complex subunit sigma-1-like [Sycon ciliatum]|uniref:AP-5 complex subunit sigma-1-like n=1 Tax=Sycon ciliatum TaxID=27933 RepID=UPI0020AAE579|eukprot:scpid61817/ scgid15380/ AP-5 complex subunit sigma-1; Adapter-related protein complex 5 sigma subunit